MRQRTHERSPTVHQEWLSPGRDRRAVPRPPGAQGHLARAVSTASATPTTGWSPSSRRSSSGSAPSTPTSSSRRRRSPRTRTTRYAAPGSTSSSTTSPDGQDLRSPTRTAVDLEVRSPGEQITVAPDGALAGPGRRARGAAPGLRARPPSLRDAGLDGWAATEIDRMADAAAQGAGRGRHRHRRPVVGDRLGQGRQADRLRHGQRPDLGRGAAAARRVPHPDRPAPLPRQGPRAAAAAALRAQRARGRGDHRGARHPGPQVRRAARPGVLRGPARGRRGTAIPTRSPRSRTTSTRPPSR